jgi:hypothetical protein
MYRVTNQNVMIYRWVFLNVRAVFYLYVLAIKHLLRLAIYVHVVNPSVVIYQRCVKFVIFHWFLHHILHVHIIIYFQSINLKGKRCYKQTINKKKTFHVLIEPPRLYLRFLLRFYFRRNALGVCYLLSWNKMQHILVEIVSIVSVVNVTYIYMTLYTIVLDAARRLCLRVT